MRAPYFLFWKDRQNVYVGCNENFAKLCGVVDIEDIVGKKDLALAWPREQAETLMKADHDVMESAQALLDHEEMCVGNSNTRMCVLASRVPFFDDKGGMWLVLWACLLISQRFVNVRLFWQRSFQICSD